MSAYSAWDKKPAWEIVEHRGAAGCTERLEIPEGWLYRSWVQSGREEHHYGLVFVPAARGQ